jgi:hypothetical protein
LQVLRKLNFHYRVENSKPNSRNTFQKLTSHSLTPFLILSCRINLRLQSDFPCNVRTQFPPASYHLYFSTSIYSLQHCVCKTPFNLKFSL